MKKKQREQKMEKEFRMRIQKLLRWVEVYPEDEEIKHRVFFRGIGYLLHSLKKSSESQGNTCFYKHLINFAENLEEIEKAKLNGIPFDEISKKYIFGIKKRDPSYV